MLRFIPLAELPEAGRCQYHYEKGRALALLGRHGEAEQNFTHALSLQQRSPRANPQHQALVLAGLADALIGQQKIYAAAHHLCSATELAFAVGRETLASAKLGPGGVIAFGPKFAFEQ